MMINGKQSSPHVFVRQTERKVGECQQPDDVCHLDAESRDLSEVRIIDGHV